MNRSGRADTESRRDLEGAGEGSGGMNRSGRADTERGQQLAPLQVEGGGMNRSGRADTESFVHVEGDGVIDGWHESIRQSGY